MKTSNAKAATGRINYAHAARNFVRLDFPPSSLSLSLSLSLARARALSLSLFLGMCTKETN